MTEYIICPRCGGDGYYADEPCQLCAGTGLVPEHHERDRWQQLELWRQQLDAFHRQAARGQPMKRTTLALGALAVAGTGLVPEHHSDDHWQQLELWPKPKRPSIPWDRLAADGVILVITPPEPRRHR